MKKIRRILTTAFLIGVIILNNNYTVYAAQTRELSNLGWNYKEVKYHNVERIFGRNGYNTASRYDIYMKETDGWNKKIELSGTSSVMVYNGTFDSASIKASVHVSGIGSISVGDSLGAATSNDTYVTDVYTRYNDRDYKTEVKGKFYYFLPWSYDLTVTATYNIGNRTFVDQY